MPWNQKSNRGWSPLHLAVYFGHTAVAKLLLEHDADVNIVNSVGDTPLHRAAYTGRHEAVTLLVQHKADIHVINAEGFSPKDVARNKDINKLLEAAENHRTLETSPKNSCRSVQEMATWTNTVQGCS
ncbi:oxysterol-binding protein-related protein 1/2 [Mytilus galloprovincialis]|uniref:Oxysterol-binding protein-related protein 1/2 n=1 Tax=Mytilus galloprovincialis TaxID=29158 RepID=A0A8B6GMY1_MYTGA|nr:oxysterol-binding protein-related protein 1/2 [Mytilus galloprovincialis]